MNQRGQSALEYLMTYGWALVVIVVAVAALVILVNPSDIRGTTCDPRMGPVVVNLGETGASTSQFNLVTTNTAGVNLSGLVFTGTTVTGCTLGTLPSATTQSAGETKVHVIPWGGGNCASGTAYTLAVALTYNTPSVSGLSATGSCSGTV